MPDVLTRICNDKRNHIAAQKKKVSVADLEEQIKATATTCGFIKALRDTHRNNRVALIAEIKKASPSKGIICEDFDAVEIAKIYQKAGASCLSVLTDEPYFQGSDHYFKNVRAHISLPLIRKDFMIDPYQIYESRAMGADCVLLIMAALDNAEAKDLYTLSSALGMDVLVEVHDKEELNRALLLSPEMVGVNSRNLKTLEVDIQNAHEMIREMPSDILKIAESGIKNYDDVQSLLDIGAQGFLVGESLMRQDNIYAATQTLLGNDFGNELTQNKNLCRT